VTGGDDLGPWMTSHPGIDLITFTGSTFTGKRVLASAAAKLKRVTLELGGNDPGIILADAEPEKIAPFRVSLIGKNEERGAAGSSEYTRVKNRLIHECLLAAT
jgi:acyl-CoA reductase-like NAD-dependent aldehyde dehydrogenase